MSDRHLSDAPLNSVAPVKLGQIPNSPKPHRHSLSRLGLVSIPFQLGTQTARAAYTNLNQGLYTYHVYQQYRKQHRLINTLAALVRVSLMTSSTHVCEGPCGPLCGHPRAAQNL